MTKKRYPLEDLAAASGIPMGALGGRLGISGSTWKDYRDNGVTELVGDRLAVKLDLNAYAVWPEMVDDAMAELEVPCPREGCTGTFIPKTRGPHRRYCSPACRQAAYRAKKSATDPDYLAKRRQEAADYYAEFGEYCRARTRRRYWQQPEAERARVAAYRARRAA